MSTKTQGPAGAAGAIGHTGAVGATGPAGPAGPAGASGVAATSEHFAKLEREIAELKTAVNENHAQLEQYVSNLSALEGVVASRRGMFQSKSAHEETVDRAQEGN